MKLNNWVVCFLFVLLVSNCALAYRNLAWARQLMDMGNFPGARNEFIDVSRYAYNESERREAAYFVGFCSVKMHDPWQAISDLRWFLDRFDCGYRQYVPDALYVLGRTYEEIRDIRAAYNCYHGCIDRFPYSEFASKSRDRMHECNTSYPMNYSIEAIPGKSSASSKKNDKKASKEDPFEGFSMDQKRIERVTNFLTAVKENKNVGSALKGLTTDDAHLSVVKENVKKVAEKQKFDNMHKFP